MLLPASRWAARKPLHNHAAEMHREVVKLWWTWLPRSHMTNDGRGEHRAPQKNREKWQDWLDAMWENGEKLYTCLKCCIFNVLHGKVYTIAGKNEYLTYHSLCTLLQLWLDNWLDNVFTSFYIWGVFEQREENKKKKIGNTVGHLEISKQHISVDKTCKNKKKHWHYNRL